jgi:hypothetical protein
MEEEEEKDHSASLLRVDPSAAVNTEALPNGGGCGYQGYEFGAGSYPDSVCIDGQLFDADHCDSAGNLYEPDEYWPCPICDKKAAIRFWRERGNKHAKQLIEDIRRNRGLEC